MLIDHQKFCWGVPAIMAGESDSWSSRCTYSPRVCMGRWHCLPTLNCRLYRPQSAVNCLALWERAVDRLSRISNHWTWWCHWVCQQANLKKMVVLANLNCKFTSFWLIEGTKKLRMQFCLEFARMGACGWVICIGIFAWIRLANARWWFPLVKVTCPWRSHLSHLSRRGLRYGSWS